MEPFADQTFLDFTTVFQVYSVPVPRRNKAENRECADYFPWMPLATLYIGHRSRLTRLQQEIRSHPISDG